MLAWPGSYLLSGEVQERGPWPSWCNRLRQSFAFILRYEANDRAKGDKDSWMSDDGFMELSGRYIKLACEPGRQDAEIWVFYRAGSMAGCGEQCWWRNIRLFLEEPAE